VEIVNSQRDTAIAQELKTHAVILGSCVALFWAIEIWDLISGGTLNRYGIRPRELTGLWGIFFAPFLHSTLAHVAANTASFLVLGWLVMLRRTRDFWVVSLIAMIIGGLGTWLIGAPRTVHLGASGVIFGYLGFLLFRGYFERRILSMFLALVTGFLYGGMLWGILPLQFRVSWQGHLFGFIGGVIAARLLAEPHANTTHEL
jgi:membrane associated rhomboid family serine protease